MKHRLVNITKNHLDDLVDTLVENLQYCDSEVEYPDIDKAQPADEQLGVAFITAQEVSPSDLKIGDKVWLQNFSGKWEIYTIVGFGPDEMHNDTNVKGVPYVDNYDHNGDYSWNINNYIRAETVRKV